MLLQAFFGFLIFSIPLSAKPFVKGSLWGQLGNQLFIIAATVSLALDNDADPIFPDLVINPNYNLPLNRQKIFSHLNVVMPAGAKIESYYNEPHFHYAPIPYTPNMQIHGYYQSEKYFEKHKKEILDLFAPSNEIKDYLNGKYKDIIDHPNAVAVHIRYYFEDPSESIFFACSPEYIRKAMSTFSDDPLFVIFTNDQNYSKKVLEGVTGNIRLIQGEPHFHDFYLMSMCKHNIISNSSFSWWSAYLNANPNKVVIAPKKWFTQSSGLDVKDLIPSSWKVMD